LKSVEDTPFCVHASCDIATQCFPVIVGHFHWPRPSLTWHSLISLFLLLSLGSETINFSLDYYCHPLTTSPAEYSQQSRNKKKAGWRQSNLSSGTQRKSSLRSHHRSRSNQCNDRGQARTTQSLSLNFNSQLEIDRL